MGDHSCENRQIVLRQYPSGPPAEETFELGHTAVPELGEGEVLVRTLYLSVDPYMRGLMTGVEGNYPQFTLGAPIVSGGVGQIVESRHPALGCGDFVEGALAWQDYCVSGTITSHLPHVGRGVQTGIRKLDSRITHLSDALGIFGMSGLTAYFGIEEIGKPQPGETVVISAAAGAVGSVAGQIAKIYGSRVIGLVGSNEKARYITKDLGFDAAVNYKSSAFVAELRSACPEGIDLYFENVGGATSEIVFDQLKVCGRVVLCGMIATYNDPHRSGQANLWPILLKSIRLQGLMFYLYENRFPAAVAQLAEWKAYGRLKAPETVVEGLENAPRAFASLYQGNNIGKVVVKVSDPLET